MVSGLRRQKLSTVVSLALIGCLTIVIVNHSFKGVTTSVDGVMHLSRIQIIADSLPNIPTWNPYWYFGVPMLRFYSPLFYYMVAIIGWLFQLSLADAFLTFTYLLFSVGALSIYFLAGELELSPVGRVASSVLFLTSINLFDSWGRIGSYPYVTSAIFSIPALAFIFRAIKKQTIFNVLIGGLSLAIVALTYVMSVLVLMIFLTLISIYLVFRRPELLFISRGPRAPPAYTLRLPKIIGLTFLVAGALSTWWLLPFYVVYQSSPYEVTGLFIPSASYIGFFEQLLTQLGSRVYPGFGHIVLALIGCALSIFFISGRKVYAVIPAVCFIAAFMICAFPAGLAHSRFPLFLSIFTALVGGLAIEYSASVAKIFKERTARTVISLAVAGILLLSFSFVDAYRIPIYEAVSLEQPNSVDVLNSYAKPGERVGIDGGYGFNIHHKIGQSGGGSIQSMYSLNRYAYPFWYHLLRQHDSMYLPYFAKNYNVRFFLGKPVHGLKEVQLGTGIFEIEGFNSSFAEILDSDDTLVLFIGDDSEYQRMFTSIALANPSALVLILGEYVDDFDLNTLLHFDVIYLQGLRFKNREVFRELLIKYVESGGGIILDTGDVSYGTLSDVLDPFPIESTGVGASHFLLKQNISSPIIDEVDVGAFSSDRVLSISHAKNIKNGATVLITDEFERPVLVFWGYKGRGTVFWSGLRLPYKIMLDQDLKYQGEVDVKPADESRLLSNIIVHAKSSHSSEPKPKSSATFESPTTEEIIVYVKNVCPEDGLWIKMTYYPGWRASIEGEDLTVLRTGPNMMSVFPDRSGDYAITFKFSETIEVSVGKILSLFTITSIPVVVALRHIRQMKQKGTPSANASYPRKI